MDSPPTLLTQFNMRKIFFTGEISKAQHRANYNKKDQLLQSGQYTQHGGAEINIHSKIQNCQTNNTEYLKERKFCFEQKDGYIKQR